MLGLRLGREEAIRMGKTAGKRVFLAANEGCLSGHWRCLLVS
jgi:hypothetical protein